MRGLIDPDSKLFALLHKLTLLMELNVLVVLCCLPLVTAGAAFSSMHAVLLKIYRGEEKQIAGDFFRAMKSNLKNGTVLWLMFFAWLGLLAGLWTAAAGSVPLLVLLPAAIVGAMYLDWALILQSRYVYTVPQCLKNAFLAWMQHPGSTLVYPVSIVIPLLLCLKLQLLPLVCLLGITLPHFISTTLYSRVFDRMEGVPERTDQQ